MGSVTIEHMRDLQKKVNLCTHTLLLYFFYFKGHSDNNNIFRPNGNIESLWHFPFPEKETTSLPSHSPEFPNEHLLCVCTAQQPALSIKCTHLPWEHWPPISPDITLCNLLSPLPCMVISHMIGAAFVTVT